MTNSLLNTSMKEKAVAKPVRDQQIVSHLNRSKASSSSASVGSYLLISRISL
jgi:hypothetical protein